MIRNKTKLSQLAVLVKFVMLRKDSPEASKLASMMYRELMITHQDGFSSMGIMAEKEAQRIMQSVLPASLLGDVSDPGRKFPDALRPELLDKVESRLHSFLESDDVMRKRTGFEKTLKSILDTVGWQYGIEHLPEATEMLRKKIRKRIGVYERSIAVLRPNVDVLSLYEHAVNIPEAERALKRNDKDIAEFYTALCKTASNVCRKIITRFLRDTIESICDSDEWDRVIDSIKKLRTYCHKLVKEYPLGDNYPDIFSNPDVNDLNEFL